MAPMYKGTIVPKKEADAWWRYEAVMRDSLVTLASHELTGPALPSAPQGHMGAPGVLVFYLLE